MGVISRRRFAAVLGLASVGGSLGRVYGQTRGEEHKVAAAPTKPDPAAPKTPSTTTKPASPTVAPVDRTNAAPEQIWAELMQGNKRFVSGKPNPPDVVRARAETARRSIRLSSSSAVQIAGSAPSSSLTRMSGPSSWSEHWAMSPTPLRWRVWNMPWRNSDRGCCLFWDARGVVWLRRRFRASRKLQKTSLLW
jgi:hypothetical protein